MKAILFILFFPIVLVGQVKKVAPGIYEITKNNLAIFDNYTKLYFQCSSSFDSAAIQLSVLKQNFFEMGQAQARSENKIYELSINLDKSAVDIANLKADNSLLKLENTNLALSIKREKRKALFTKIGVGAAGLAAVIFALR